jgi:release factor glutamine methyltransferase
VQNNTRLKRIEELLSEGKRILASNNIDSPALDAALLLGKVLNLPREKLVTHNDQEATEAQCRYFFDLIKRRCDGECTAYILGKKEFWGLEFTVTPSVLVPRSDTEILVEAALSIIRSCTANLRFPILDLCTGSGAVAIALKHECPDLEVWAVDISEDAVAIARQNAERLGCTVAFLEGDLFNAINNRQRFCIITANAPYIPSADIALLPPEVKHEPHLALDGGHDGLDIIRRIIMESPLYLETGGTLILEADPSQMESIAALMKENSFSFPEFYKDLAGKNRVIASSIPLIKGSPQ